MSVFVDDGELMRFVALNVNAAATEIRRVEKRKWGAIVRVLHIGRRGRIVLWTSDGAPQGWRLLGEEPLQGRTGEFGMPIEPDEPSTLRILAARWEEKNPHTGTSQWIEVDGKLRRWLEYTGAWAEMAEEILGDMEAGPDPDAENDRMDTRQGDLK